MHTVTAAQMNHTPGQAFDQVLREGLVALTRHGQLAALLARDLPAAASAAEISNASTTGLWRYLSDMLDAAARTGQVYAITRHGSTIYLLPPAYRQILGIEL